MAFTPKTITKELDFANLANHNTNNTAIKAELDAHDTHVAAQTAHGSTSAATAGKIVQRDSNGRAKVAAPSASDDIARKAEVDAVQTNLTEHVSDADVHLSTTDRTKFTGITPGAEPNQNAFAKVNNVEAATPSDSLTFEGGTGITVTTNPTTKKVTVTATGEATPGAHGSSHNNDGADPIPELVALRSEFDGAVTQLAEYVLNEKFGNKELVRLFAPKIDPNTLFKHINVLGDSITQGANAPDIPNDSWAGIMRKFVNLEYGNENYGYVSMLDKLTNAQGTYQDMHSIVIDSGTWTEISDGNYFGSFARETSSNLGQLIVTVSKASNHFRIYHAIGPDRGTFNVYINGVFVVTIDAYHPTLSATFQYTQPIDVSYLQAPYTISIENTTTKKLTLSGIGYYSDESQMMFNNYSRDGLTLASISDKMLDIMTSTNLLFFSLGLNDEIVGDITTFSTGIDKVISKINTSGAVIVVCDFIWNKTLASSPFKQQLKRLADSCEGLYINFSEDVFRSTDTTALTTAGILSDGAHPTVQGHQMIAEVVAKKIGLGTTSKKVAEQIIRNSSTILFCNPMTAFTHASTSESILNTFILPSSYLAPRKKIRVKSFGLFGENTNNKTVKLYFGAQVVAIITGNHQNLNWDIDVEIIHRSSTIQIIRSTKTVGSTTSVLAYGGTNDISQPIEIKLTGQNGTAVAGDITCFAMTVELV